MPTYNYTVTRDGRWWMIHVPAIDQLTRPATKVRSS